MTNSAPNADQIRAALALLKWENVDLARACKIAPQSVSNIKRGATRPQPRILSSISKVLESAGIEFLDHSGVRLKPEGVDILQGTDGFLKFYEILYERVSLFRGTICVGGVDEKLFVKHLGSATAPHIQRMQQLIKSSKDIHMKILVREHDTYFPGSEYATYRWQSAENFSPTAFYVFADYLGLISFYGDNAPKIILIHSTVFANAYRKQFMEQWKLAAVPPRKS